MKRISKTYFDGECKNYISIWFFVHYCKIGWNLHSLVILYKHQKLKLAGKILQNNHLYWDVAIFQNILIKQHKLVLC